MEQPITVTTFIKLDLIDVIKCLLGRSIKIETKVVVLQEQKINQYNAMSSTTIVPSGGLFVKQDRPRFGYTEKIG